MDQSATIAACECDLLTNGVRIRAVHAEQGPEKPGWSMIYASGYNEEYYVNITHCPFCGRKLDTSSGEGSG